MHFDKCKGFLLRKQWKFESAIGCCVRGSPVVAFFFVMQLAFRGPKLDKLFSGRSPNADVGVNINYSICLTYPMCLGMVMVSKRKYPLCLGMIMYQYLGNDYLIF